MQISNTSLSMYAGEKKSLSASATRTEMTTSGISWESSDTNIATVSSNGLVTAKHPGTVTISCYGNNAKGIKASCKVTVKLKQPAGLKIASKAYNKINLAWSAVTGLLCDLPKRKRWKRKQTDEYEIQYTKLE